MLLGIHLVAKAQNSSDSGYLVRKSWDKSPSVFIFIPSTVSNGSRFDIREIAKSEVAYQFFLVKDSIGEILSEKFLSDGIKIRNEAEMFCMKGIYSPFLEKYKDDYFHLSFYPVRLQMQKISHYQSFVNEPQVFEFTSFGIKVILSYKSAGQYKINVIDWIELATENDVH